MRGWSLVLAIVGGVILVSALAAATGGRDNSGETVRASTWADDVCGTVGAWEGQLEDIREEMQRNNYAARQNDGGSGDSVEEHVTVHQAVDRAIEATQDTLEEGLKRAGIPDEIRGAAASLILRDWAERTESSLRVAKAQIRQKPRSVSEAFANLVPPVTALARSAIAGRAAFREVAALDPALEEAVDRSGNCRRLMEDTP